MADNIYKNYVQFIRDQNLPILGMLAFYGVSSTAVVDCFELEECIEEHSAPMKPPRKPNAADVFRRACGEAERKKIPTDVPHEFVNYLLRDAKYDEDKVYRILVAERVDGKNHSLGHRNIAKLSFVRDAEVVEVDEEYDDRTGEWADLTDHPVAATIIEEIVEYVKTMRTAVSTTQLREAIRVAFEDDMMGISARKGGGIYFIDNDHLEQLQALDTVVNHFEGLSLEMAPLLDHDRQRTMIKEAFEDKSIHEANRIIAELHELNQQDVVSGRKFTDIKVRADEAKARVKQYKKIVGDNLLDTDTSLDIVDALIVSLLEKSMDG